MQLYVSLNPTDFGTLSDIESCTSDVSSWFIENALLLNPTKTEAVVFGTSQRLSQVNKSQGVWVAEAHVQFTDAVKLLGVTLDSTLSFDKHIIDVTRSCHYHIRAMRHIRPLLTLDAAKAMAVSIVGCRLDYCNSVLYGMSQANIDKLQRVQNILARVVVGTSSTYENPSRFTLVTCWPSYYSLPVSAPSTRNTLPAHIRSIDTLSTFKRHIKFHIFQSAFTVTSSCASALDSFSRFWRYINLHKCMYACMYKQQVVGELAMFQITSKSKLCRWHTRSKKCVNKGRNVHGIARHSCAVLYQISLMIAKIVIAESTKF